MKEQHKSKIVTVTMTTSGKSGTLVINSRHTFPPVSTEWWPSTVKRLLTKELRTNNVDSVSMIEVDNVF
jgi:hypothetical protein